MEVTLIDSMGSDLSVVNAARVSFHKESEWGTDTVYSEDGEHFENIHVLKESDAKLINYLAKHGHWTPFGHAFLSFRIKAPIFVARQLVKHQVGLCWNEVSRRYVDEEPEFWFPEILRYRAANIKQGSGGDVPADHAYDLLSHMRGRAENDLYLYEDLLKEGIAPEQARMVLPLNTHTEWIWSGSLAAFARVCKLRLDPHAQAETRLIAEKINAAVPDAFAYSWSALLG
jgi:thymidylate synthase (FAD)